MTDQEALNRLFSEAFAGNTAVVQHCMEEIKSLKKDVQEASGDINKGLFKQGLQLERIEGKLEGLEKLEDHLYGRGQAPGLLARTQRLEQLRADEDETFVTKEEFAPIKKLVYGSVSLILTAVLIAILSFVVMHK